ncbi:hypothetical protein PENSPDRAFT_171112 [Peniophora sp. CONT]|nr:hypothetical protein PENSPDRAFT_171112 [Peniophora sp. CONT]
MSMRCIQRATFRVDGASEDFCIKPSRVLHGVVLEELKPATDLIAPDFLRAVLQSVQCHHRAWTAGIHHKDVALGNFMYSAGKNGEPLGILVDWDVAPRKDTHQINRSGTIPFMALDFLRSPDKHIEHLYQHDLEAMFWVLVWACYPKGTFRDWDYHNCYLEMLTFSDWDTSKVMIMTEKWGRWTKCTLRHMPQ